MPLFSSGVAARASGDVRRDEYRIRSNFTAFFSGRDFLFSYNYDLGQSLQINSAMVEPVVTAARDNRFHWNWNHSKLWKDIFRDSSNDDVALGTLLLVNGSVATRSLLLEARRLDVVLIARRSRLFAGTRYLKRGEDSECRGDR